MSTINIFDDPRTYSKMFEFVKTNDEDGYFDFIYELLINNYKDYVDSKDDPKISKLDMIDDITENFKHREMYEECNELKRLKITLKEDLDQKFKNLEL